MATLLILSLALFAGVTSAQFDFQYVNAPTNSTGNGTLPDPPLNPILRSFPSVVQIEFFTPWGWSHWNQKCAGSILNSQNVLSARTCFSGPSFDKEARRIRAGSDFRNQGGVVLYVAAAFNFPRNSSRLNDNDISVVRLSSRLIYSSLIQQSPIPAPNSSIWNNMVVQQLGWGQQNITDQLTSAVLVVSTSPQNGTLDRRVIYANPSFQALDNFDIGSPWFWSNITVGVVSGRNTNATGFLFEAASVSYFTNWILSVV